MEIEMVQLTAVTMGLVQVLKPFLPGDRYYALASVVIGVLVSMAYAIVTGHSAAAAAFDGVVVGLISCGAYDVATAGMKDDGPNLPHDEG